MDAIKNRYEFVILFDVENGNPNGDPDAATRLFCEEAAKQGAQIFRIHDVARHRGLR